jgi:hypothetical protein
MRLQSGTSRGALAGLGLVIVLSILPAGSARAATEALSPEEAAILASDVQSEFCSDVSADEPETQALAMEQAAPVYRQVSVAYRTHGNPFLLYWRGLLAECLMQAVQAREDYGLFIETNANDRSYAPQVRDARRRLARLSRGVTRSVAAVAPAGVGAGVVLAAAGGGAMALGGGMHRDTWASPSFDTEAWSWTGTPEDYDRSLTVNRAGFGVLVGGAAAAVGGVVALIASAAKPSRRASGLTVGGTLLATADGQVLLVLGGRF